MFFDTLINDSSLFFYVSFVVQIFCDSWNEKSSTVIETGDKEQDIFSRPAAEKENLDMELTRHRGQIQGNGIVRLYWLNKHRFQVFLTSNYATGCSDANLAAKRCLNSCFKNFLTILNNFSYEYFLVLFL